MIIVALVMVTACGLGYARPRARDLEQRDPATAPSRATSTPDSGVGVAVVAVLLSVWLVAAVISSPNSRFTSLDAAVARSDILHSIDSVLPQAPSVFNDLQTFLNNQGFPQVFSTLTPPSTPNVAPPDDGADECVGRRGHLLDGQDPRDGVRQRAGGIGLRRRPRAGRDQRARGGRRGAGNTQVVVGGTAYGATPVLFDPSFDLAVLRTDAPLGTGADHRARAWSPTGTQAAMLGLPRGRPAHGRPGRRHRGDHAIGQGHLQQRLGDPGRVRAGRRRAPGNSGGPLIGPGGQVIGVVFSRSTVYPNVGYALTSPGVLSRVQQRGATAAPEPGAAPGRASRAERQE